MSDSNSGTKRVLALLVGGGPAPGINGVISAATLEAVNRGFTVLGVRDGYKWLVAGDIGHVKELKIEDVVRIYDKGGSILGTSRTNPAKRDENKRDRLPEVLDSFGRLGVTHLVSIGGDDTAFSANKLFQASGGKLRVAHVPKTIDNDIPLPGWTPTFGFETARHRGVAMVKALAEDAKTTSRWYIVVSMGRAAGHLALGVGKSAAAHLTIIPEEYEAREQDATWEPESDGALDLSKLNKNGKTTAARKEESDAGLVHFREIIDTIMSTMLKRRAMGKEYGIVVLAEGLIESIGVYRLKRAMAALAGRQNYNSIDVYGTIELDPHGHPRLGEVEFGRMIKDALKVYGAQFGLTTTFVDKDLGYELRCADPIPFDVEYTRNLGYCAVKYLLSDKPEDRDGALISFHQGRMLPMHFGKIFAEADRLPTRKVEVHGEIYEVARHYMHRLDASDFNNVVALDNIAKVAKCSPEEFRRHFGYLVGTGQAPWLRHKSSVSAPVA